LDGMKRVCASR